MLESLRIAARACPRAFIAVTFFLIVACGFSDAFSESFNEGMAEEGRAALDSADRLLAAAEPSPERDELMSISQALRAGLEDGSLDTMAVTFSAGMIEGAAEDGVLTGRELETTRSALPDGIQLP